jgi:flagellar protein FlaG
MNIKGVNLVPMDKVSAYARKSETAEQVNPAQSQPRSIPHNLSGEDISGLIDKLNNGVRDIHERISFSYHEKTQRIVVKIVNSDTNEVIREIPPKDAIKLLEHIQDFLGMLVDESR